MHDGLNALLTVPNVKCPFDPTAVLRLVSYNLYENGTRTNVEPSSVWFPVSVVPGTIAPEPTVYKYDGVQAAVAVGDAVAVAVGVNVAVATGVNVAVAVAVAVAVGVNVAVAVGVNVAVAVGVNVSPLPWCWC